MANDFSTDANCVAVWRFENGALTADSKGSNTLTSNGTPVSDTVDFKEGAGCVDLELSDVDYYSITDASLDAGFPLKNGDTNKKISVCAWFKLESVSVAQYIYMKGAHSTNKRSFAVYFDGTKLNILLGITSGTAYETITHASSLTTGRWYHCGATFDDASKAYNIRIWDDTAAAIAGTDKTGTSTNNVNVADAALQIGARDAGNAPLDARLDEVVVFKDILTADEIDAIRAGTYVGSASTFNFDGVPVSAINSAPGARFGGT